MHAHALSLDIIVLNSGLCNSAEAWLEAMKSYSCAIAKLSRIYGFYLNHE